MQSETPVADTAARLDALDPYAGFAVAPPLDDDWVRLADVESDGQLDTWMARLTTLHGRRNVAGSMLGVQLGEAVIGVTVAALTLDGRCPEPTADNLAVRVHPEGYLERRAVLAPDVAVLPGDPAATDPRSVVVADGDALAEWWAARVVATLAPLLVAVRARAPFSLRNLWGGIADEVTGTAIWVAQLAGRDADDAWRHGVRLLDALARHAPVRFARGHPFPVTYPGGRRLFQVRGTCCLYYRSAAETGPPEETYCNTCPLRDDDSRHRRLHDHVTDTEAH